MAEPIEYLLVVLSVATAIVALRRRSGAAIFPSLSRISGRRTVSPIACPKSGRRVLCTLVYHERTGECLGVDSCTTFGNSPVPHCDKDCVKLLNLGISLRPLEPPPNPVEGDSGTTKVPQLGVGQSGAER